MQHHTNGDASHKGGPRGHLLINLGGGSSQHRECTPWEPWGGSVRGCEEEPILRFSLWLDNLRESLRKQEGFALDWTLSGSGTTLCLGILINLVQREGAWCEESGSWRRSRSHSAQRGSVRYFAGGPKVLFSFVLRQNCEGGLFCSSLDVLRHPWSEVLILTGE